MNLVICEDNDKERLKICNVLKQYFDRRNETVTIFEYEDGETLLADLQEKYIRPDMYFLDIYMNQMTGVEIAHRIREYQIQVPLIFITSTAEFAVESIDHKLMVHMRNREILQLRDKLDLFEQKLGAPCFLRCHKSFLVNMDDISRVDGDFVMQDGSRIPIRVRSAKQTIETYYRYLVTHTIERLPGGNGYA